MPPDIALPSERVTSEIAFAGPIATFACCRKTRYPQDYATSGNPYLMLSLAMAQKLVQTAKSIEGRLITP